MTITVRILTGLALLASSMLAGAALGLLWVKLFVAPKDMGWDGLADALGGMMLGALIGLVAAGFMIALLSVRRQWAGFGITAAVAVLTVVGLVRTAPERREAPPPVAKKSFQPTFRVGLRVGHTREILSVVASDERPIPFVEAEVSTGKPELVFVGWGPAFHRCTAAPTEVDLESLVPRIRRVIAASSSYCRTPEDDLTLSVSWNLAGDIGNQGLEAGCLPDQPALRELVDAVNVLGERLCGEISMDTDRR